jgi:putative SOS response-associated peptidase YedK
MKARIVAIDLYAFITCTPNAEVEAIHPKAMPVILRTSEEIEIWLTESPGGAPIAAAFTGWQP